MLRRLGRFLVAQSEPSGAVLASYDPARGAPRPGEYSKYYTGEAYWALARLHRTFPGEGWGEAADRTGAYLATSRDEVEDHWPPIPDHWAAYGLSETVEFPDRGRPPLTEQEVGYARRQAELFGLQARLLGQVHGPWGGVVRGEAPRGGWYGVIDEALTGLWLTAREEPRLADLRAPLAERATCVAALAVGMQADAQDAADAPRPERVEGAWFADGETRMDDQQHALAGLLRTIPIVEAGEAPDPGDDGPSGWLWAAVLVLALNPARAAFGVPRAGRAAVGVAAVGGAIGGLAVCIAATVGGPLLDALDVSEPSFRIAAGLLAVLAGAADLFRRPPAAEPSLSGWGAVARPGRDPGGGPPRPARAGAGRGRRRRSPRDRRRDGDRRRALDRAGRPVADRGPRGPGPAMGGPPDGRGACGVRGRARHRRTSWTSRRERATAPLGASGAATPRRRAGPRRAAPCPAASPRRGRAG